MSLIIREDTGLELGFQEMLEHRISSWLTPEQRQVFDTLMEWIDQRGEQEALRWCGQQDELWEALAERFPSLPILDAQDEISADLYGN